jgi:hypothetical protein
MRLGVVACDIFQRELDLLLKDDPDVVHKEYLEFGLHCEPERLKQTVIEKCNALDGKVDSIFLGYSICQSLKDVTSSIKVPSLMLDGDDCIAVFLTPVGYAQEKAKCTGTWFNTPGWANLGIKGCIKELHLDSAVEQGYDPMYFMEMLFTGYSRCLYIDTGVERERFEALSQDFARTMKLRHESRGCDLSLLKGGIEKAKKLGSL